MPFKSEKQKRFLFSQKPKVARKFADHATPQKAKKPTRKRRAKKP